MPASRGKRGSSTGPSTAAASSTRPVVERWSCWPCRKRKARCDKINPCDNCQKAGTECTFPPPGRAPPRKPKSKDAELRARVDRLESMVRTLRSPNRASSREASTGYESVGSNDTSSRSRPRRDTYGTPSFGTSPENLSSDLGTLLSSDDRTRHVTNLFWGALTEEIDDLGEELNEYFSDDDSGGSSPPYHPPATQFPINWSFSLPSSELRTAGEIMHPTPQMIFTLWDIYKTRCDPILKTIHVPTMDTSIKRVVSEPNCKACEGMDCFLFAMYTAAVVSLTPEETKDTLHEDKATLIATFRRGFERSFQKNHAMTSDGMLVLLSFTLYLLVIQEYEDAKVLWSLCGVLGRMAISSGIHRDGLGYQLSPFYVEMRRRMWWNLVYLDIRTADHLGRDPVIVYQSRDTRLPSNINDSDISHDSTELPEERVGLTDMSFPLVRFKYCRTIMEVFLSPSTVGSLRDRTGLSLPEKEHIIEQHHMDIRETVVQYCSPDEPLQYAIITLSRLAISKHWLGLYQPLQRVNEHSSTPILTDDGKEHLFTSALDIIDCAITLTRDPRLTHFHWTFSSHNQWFAVSLLLSQLAIRTRGPAVDRAWRTLRSFLGNDLERGETMVRDGKLRKAYQKLLRRACAAREEALRSERGNSADFGGVHRRMSDINSRSTPAAEDSDDNNNNPFLHISRPSMLASSSTLASVEPSVYPWQEAIMNEAVPTNSHFMEPYMPGVQSQMPLSTPWEYGHHLAPPQPMSPRYTMAEMHQISTAEWNRRLEHYGMQQGDTDQRINPSLRMPVLDEYCRQLEDIGR